jgi:hypothetical protein
MRLRRKNRDFEAEPYFEQPTFNPTALAHDLKHRLYEDPEFKRDFTTSFFEALQGSKKDAIADSKRYAEAYGDQSDNRYTEAVHEARGQAFQGIMHVIDVMGDPNTDIAVEASIQEIRRVIGEFTAEVFFQGELMPHPTLYDPKVVGIHHEGIGTLFVQERMHNDKR